jgi:uncharacterized protein with NRDE domain
MCTVTYIPLKDKYFISSNRDEKYSRGQAMPPALYRSNNRTLIYPKDADAGGSWVALHENGNAAVLLNGALEKHEPMPPYRKSRGLVFLQVIGAERPTRYFQETDLMGIEPFTLVIAEANNLYEGRWDGNEKHCRQLSSLRPHIWSSVTLYDAEMMRKREKWFAGFLNNTPQPDQKDILEFHRFTGANDAEVNLVMEREGMYATVSITSIQVTERIGSMKYIDLKNDSIHEKTIELAPAYSTT